MNMYAPQRILIAPSGFKESASAEDAAEAIAAGVQRVLAQRVRGHCAYVRRR